MSVKSNFGLMESTQTSNTEMGIKAITAQEKCQHKLKNNVLARPRRKIILCGFSKEDREYTNFDILRQL